MNETKIKSKMNTIQEEAYKRRITNMDDRMDAFEKGWQEAERQPPTSETIDRFLALYNEYCHVPSAALKLYPTAKDYIKAKWNEDKAKID